MPVEGALQRSLVRMGAATLGCAIGVPVDVDGIEEAA